MTTSDSFGLAIPLELAAAVIAQTRNEVNHVELILERAYNAKNADTMAALAAHAPLCLHGISLGLAGVEDIATHRLRKIAEVVQSVKPLLWSEHLAFVRHQNFEVGHLAVPPRTKRSASAAADNLKRIADLVGSMPLVENTATLGIPPGSTMPEGEWIGDICETADTNLLLDLHNVVTNAFNEKKDATELLLSMPIHRVREVHIAGGRELLHRSGESRILDDHMHAAPSAVFAMLEVLGANTVSALFVTVEREAVRQGQDGEQTVTSMLADLERARAALTEGRRRRTAPSTSGQERESVPDAQLDLTDELVPFLAWIYSRPELAERFFAAPEATLRELRASEPLKTCLLSSDFIGLEFAVRSFAHKRH